MNQEIITHERKTKLNQNDSYFITVRQRPKILSLELTPKSDGRGFPHTRRIE